MNTSRKYRIRLDNYLDWAEVFTPASEYQGRNVGNFIIVSNNGVGAEDAMFQYETHGNAVPVLPGEACLAKRYARGKANRDFWTKEIGWWDKYAVYIPEEFIGMLGPLPFIDLFGRLPITEFVRLYYDNNYSNLAFKIDMKIKSLTGAGTRLWFFERDDRMSWQKVLWKITQMRFISPWLWKTKRLILR